MGIENLVNREEIIHFALDLILPGESS
ncbi:hypothetical protein N9414_03568 [Nodularia spumigena CCY9414]|nr:hypothetical protein N9414_03568 [Nodularia spumigena CCY9414]